MGHGKGLAIVERAYAAESDWRYGVRAAIAALLEFLASEPAFAHIALIDALTATARSAERSSVGVSAYAPMLVPGLDGGLATPLLRLGHDEAAGRSDGADGRGRVGDGDESGLRPPRKDRFQRGWDT